jgi:hypothetical protein
LQAGNAFSDKVCKLRRLVSGDFGGKILPFDREFIDRQHLRVIYKHKNVQMFQVTENRPHNFSYPSSRVLVAR